MASASAARTAAAVRAGGIDWPTNGPHGVGVAWGLAGSARREANSGFDVERSLFEEGASVVNIERPTGTKAIPLRREPFERHIGDRGERLSAARSIVV